MTAQIAVGRENRLLISLPLVLCIVIAAWATFIVNRTFEDEGSGLKTIGHYAPLPTSSSSQLRIGRAPGNDLVVGDLHFEAEAALMQARGPEWSFAPGPKGETVRVADSNAPPGEAIPGPGVFDLSRLNDHLRIEIEDVALLRIVRSSSPNLALLIPLEIGREEHSISLAFRVCPDRSVRVGSHGAIPESACVSGVTASQEYVLTRGRQISMIDNLGQIKVDWIDDPKSTPLNISSWQANHKLREELLWAGGAVHLQEVKALVMRTNGSFVSWILARTKTWFSNKRYWPDGAVVRIISADPSGSSVVVSAGATRIGETSAVTRRPTERVRIGSATFTVQTPIRGSATEQFVALYRTPGDFWTPDRVSLTDFSAVLFRASDDPGLYRPYPLIHVPSCDGAVPPALWIPSTDSSLASDIDISGSAPPTKLYWISDIVTPSWLPSSRAGRGVVACLNGKKFQFSGVTDRGRTIPPTFDAVFRGSDPVPKEIALSENSVELDPGDVVYYGGQIFQLSIEPRSHSASVGALLATIPLIFIAAVAPIAVFLGRRQAAALSVRRMSTVIEGRILRTVTILAPGLALPVVVGMMTVGGGFHLRLAADSQLSGSPRDLNAFMIANVLALASVSRFVVWLTDRGPGSMRRSVRLFMASLTSASIACLWVKPLVFALWRAIPIHALLPISRPPWLLNFVPALLIAVYLVLNPAWAILERLFHAFRSVTAERLGRISLITPATRVVLDRVHHWLPKWSWEAWTDSFERTYFKWVAEKWELPLQASLQDVTSPRIRRYRSRVKFAAGALIWTLITFILPGFAIFLVSYTLARLFPSVPNMGKEIAPPLILLGAAAVASGFSHFVQTHQGVARNWAQGLACVAVCAILFVLILASPTIIVPRIYNSTFVVWGWIGILVAFSWISLKKTFYSSGLLLRGLFPFFGLLCFAAIAFKDYGAVLVWAWTLSIIGAWALAMNVFVEDSSTGWSASFGASLGAAILAVLPPIVLGTFNSLKWDLAGLSSFDLGRATARFSLVGAPFYYNEGEWLTRVQLMAAGTKAVRWIPNMNSDVAVNGLRHVLPHGLNLFAGFMGFLLILLGIVLAESYRRAALTEDPGQRAQRLGTALTVAVALFGLGMLLIIHLGASVFDVLPLTGVPCPWLSNSFLTHVVMTCLIMYALLRAADLSALSEVE